MENMKLQPKRVIECPYCGYQYLPGEIFYPKNTLGQPDSVVRDSFGKIIYYEYRECQEALAEEPYTCDNCSRQFIATVELEVGSKQQAAELDFSNLSAKLF